MYTVLVIFATFFLVVEAFALGMMLFEIADSYEMYRTYKTQQPDVAIRANEYMSSELSSLITLLLCFIATVLVFVGTLKNYTDEKLLDYKNGNIQCEEIIKTKNRPNETPQVDTTYRFYKVKK